MSALIPSQAARNASRRPCRVEDFLELVVRQFFRHDRQVAQRSSVAAAGLRREKVAASQTAL